MLNDTQKAEVAAILDQATRLAAVDLEVLDGAEAAGYALMKEARPMLKLSAADSSWIEKQVREAVVPVPQLQPSGLLRLCLQSAVKAVLRRDRLTVEQYEAYVRGWRAVGWTVPVHPSPEGPEWADGEVTLPQPSRRDVEDFLAQLAKMTEADYETLRDLKYAAFVEHKATMYLPMMPAADFRWLVDQVRATVGAVGGLASKEVSVRISGALRAVQQIVCREKMTPQQYEALMARYRAAGVQVPAYSEREG